MKLSIIPFILNKIKSGLGIVQDTDTATQAIANGKYVFWKGKMKKASSAISVNDTLSSTNLSDVSSGALNELNDQIGSKVDTSAIANNLTTTAEDYVLDARQGKTLKGYIDQSIYYNATDTGITGVTARKHNKVVQLRIQRSTNASKGWTSFGTLTSALRPGDDFYTAMPLTNVDGGFIMVQITHAGAVQAYNTNTTANSVNGTVTFITA